MYCLVKVDGWTDIQKDLDKRPYSQWFTVIFIFLGHFIFTNLFIGIIIMVSIKLYIAKSGLQTHLRAHGGYVKPNKIGCVLQAFKEYIYSCLTKTKLL